MFKNRFFSMALLLALSSSIFLQFTTPPPSVFDDCGQLVLVLCPDDHSVEATLARYERKGKAWKQVGVTHPVNLGIKGLAWGNGLHSRKPGLQKKEGDQKSPAGLFRFGTAFGYAPAGEVSFHLPYSPITETQICVEDSRSQYYNQIVDETRVVKDWDARESMLRKDEQYKWGIFVKHNMKPEVEGGSCIFFHLWRKQGSGTLGCTAMSEENLLALMRWLDPGRKPVLVQMNEGSYEEYRRRFGLP